MGIAVSPQIHPQVAEFIDKPRQMLINGQWVKAASGKTFPTLQSRHRRSSGASRRRRSRRHRSGRESGAQPSINGPWRRMTASERGRLIWKLADLLEQHIEEFADLESLDNGKPLDCRAAADVPLAVDLFRYMAGWATKIEGNTIPISVPYTPGAKYLAYTLREPVGVVGQIIPWNFPLLMAAWKLGPALATRLHGRAEAGRADAAVRAAARRTDHGSRIPGRRRQHRPGIRRNGGRGAGRASGCRQGRVHRIDRSRQADRARGGGQSEESLAGAGRQVAQRRLQRRRSRDRDPGRGERDLLQPRPVLLRRLALCTSRRLSTTRWSKASPSTRRRSKSAPDSILTRRWDRWFQKSRLNRVCGYLESGFSEGAKAVAGGKQGRRPRLFRRADRAGQHQRKHEGRAGRNLRPGGYGDAVQGSRRNRPARQQHRLRAGCRRLDERHQQGASHGRTSCAPGPCGSTATTSSTPRCPSADTSSPAGAARWVTTCSICTPKPKQSAPEWRNCTKNLKDGGQDHRPFLSGIRDYRSISRTFSASSISVNFTSMTSFIVVCTLRPTNVASTGISRCPRSINTQSWTLRGRP